MGIKLWNTDKPTITGLERENFYLSLENQDLVKENTMLESEVHYFKCATGVLLGVLIVFTTLMVNMAITM